jgi:DNA-binding GntR family transcriptional regulator
MSDTQTAAIPTIAQLRENSLSGVVRHEIERLILGGELPAGSRVNENAIAVRLGVSRGPVREACRALVGLGLLDLVPNRGVFVRRMDRRDVQEVYDLRAGLTGLAGALLAPEVSDAALERLRALVEEMESAADLGDFERFYPVNLEFHDVILDLTGNGRLIKTYRALVKEFHLLRTHGMVRRDALKESNQEHRAILAALESHDPPAAYDASFRHVMQGKQRMLAALDNLAHEVAGRAKADGEGSRPIE